MSPILSVHALAIRRGGRLLFEQLSFKAGAGELIEIRGANGAGKTSLLRAIAGFLRPSAGAVEFSAATAGLHFLGHQNGVKGAASARDHVDYWAGLLGGDASDTLARVGLQRQGDLPARALSQGQVRRLALARLLAAPRPLWLLDEPAAGLDADGRGVLAGLIDAHRREGGAVVAALHESTGSAPTQTLNLGAA